MTSFKNSSTLPMVLTDQVRTVKVLNYNQDIVVAMSQGEG